MPKVVDEPIVRKHILLYTDDVEFLLDHYGDEMGLSDIIRNIVRQACKQIKHKAMAKAGAKPVGNGHTTEGAQDDADFAIG
jgi:uncharacterized protein (UPF0261 family)